MLYWLKVFLEVIILPPNSLVIGATVGLWLRRRYSTLGNAAIMLSAALWFLLSLPVVSGALALSRIEHYSPLRVEALGPKVGAIVVLTGGLYRNAPEYGGHDTANITSVWRARYGAMLHRRTGLPLLVVGRGPEASDVAEANAVAAVLTDEFRVPVRWVVPEGRDTIESAAAAWTTLKNEDIFSIVLVTNYSHMGRARVAFQEAGFEVYPAPTYYHGTRSQTLLHFLPWAYALAQSSHAINEWLGVVWTQLLY